MTRTNQGGSIVSFIVVGVVLALLLVGGAYLVHRHNNPAATPTPTPAEDSQEAATEESDPDESSEADTDSSTETDQSDQAASDNSSTSEESAESQADLPTGSSSPDNLPETGPTDNGLGLVGAGSMAAASVWYWRSRRGL